MEGAQHLPRWRSHKIVRAGQIVRFEQHDGGQERVIVGTGGGPEVALVMPEEVYRRGKPVIGDYIVVYDDGGYVSWSPRAAFEDGYNRLSPG